METRRRARWLIVATIGGFLLFAAAVLLESWISAGRIIARARERTAADLERLRTEKVHRPPLFEPAEEGNAWDLLWPATAVCTRAWNEGYLAAFKADKEGLFTQPSAERDAFIDSMRLPLEGLKRGLSRSYVEEGEWTSASLTELHNGHADESRCFDFLRAAVRHRIDQGRMEEATHLTVLALGLADRLKVKGGMWCDMVANVGDRVGFEAIRRLVEPGSLTSELMTRLAGVLESLETLPDATLIDVDRRDHVDDRDWLLRILDDSLGARARTDIKLWEPGLRYGYSWRVRIAQAISVVDSEEARVSHFVGRAPMEWFAGFTRVWLHDPENAPDRRHWGIMRVLQWRMMLTMARASLAAARHAVDRGTWPALLDELAPKYLPTVPVDPWAHRPLRLALKGEYAEISTVEMDADFLRAISHSQFKAADWRVWTVRRSR